MTTAPVIAPVHAGWSKPSAIVMPMNTKSEKKSARTRRMDHGEFMEKYCVWRVATRAGFDERQMR
jgi:hypothetical protein